MPQTLMPAAGQSRMMIIDVNGSNAIASMPINPYSAMSVPAWARAVTFLADNLASFPRSVRKDDAQTTHPLNELLRVRPNPLQNNFVFWRTWFFHAAHTGNGYIRIHRDPRTLAPKSLTNLLPEDVIPFRYLPPAGEIQQWYFDRNSDSAIHGDDVLHLQRISHDGMCGIDPVSMHAAPIQSAGTLERYQETYLRKGTILRGSVEIPGWASPEQMATIEAELRKHSAGNGHDLDVLLLSGGAVLKNTTISPHDSQLIEQKRDSTKQIAQITGVPPEFLFELSEAKYNASVEHAGSHVVRFTFRVWIQQAQDELTLKLLTPEERNAGLTIRINPSALERGDTAAVLNSATKQVDAGIATPNEARRLLEMPASEDPEADKLKRRGDTSPAAASAEKDAPTAET